MEEMEKKMPDLNKVLQEVQSSNRFIHKRLQQIGEQNVDYKSCSCQQESLHLSVSRLQEEDKERETQLRQIQEDMNELQTRLSRLKNDMTLTATSGESHTDHGGEKTQEMNRNNTQSKPVHLLQKISGREMKAESSTTTAANGRVVEVSSGDRMNIAAAASGRTVANKLEHRNTPIIHRQRDKKSVHALHWDLSFGVELDTAKSGPIGDLGGIHSVICLDISESMAENEAWTEARTFYLDYIKGLLKMQKEANINKEHVALVTFGHRTDVIQRFTNKFEELIARIDSIQLGGPSPIFGGMKMAVAAAGSSDRQVCFVGHLKVCSKIILITDGHFTERNVIAGPDMLPKENAEQAASETLEIFTEITNYGVDVFIVPVGKANMDFLELACGITDGIMLQYTDGEHLSRRTYQTLKASDQQQLHVGATPQMDRDTKDYMDKHMPGVQHHAAGDVDIATTLDRHAPPYLRLSQRDREEMQHIIKRCTISLEDILRLNGKKKTDDTSSSDRYQKSSSNKFPPLGTRVRRGPDWNSQKEDLEGIGTIVGHQDNDNRVLVHWDTDGSERHYRYAPGRYDVLPVNEPRVYRGDGQFLVGYVVKPTTHCRDSNIKPFDRGTIIQRPTHDKVKVRWNNGLVGNFTTTPSDKCEIQYSPPLEEHGRLSQSTSDPKSTRKQKNKNKNND